MENLILGNCLEKLKEISDSYIDLIYLDPPFFTQREHSLKNRENTKEFSFSDKWQNRTEYLDFIQEVLQECKRVLKETGSIFLHCDKTVSHYLRVLLDKIFGEDNFQSEIIWAYKRWSNAKKGLLNAHQNIYFYSKTEDFKFNFLYTDYSPTTNIDQILQARERDENGKSVYKKDKNGEDVLSPEKKGVPLSDIWQIPYLNPKAKERVGYPTQKPVLLLKKIIEIASNENDLILDPFCGSGTTGLACKLIHRNFIGIDISSEAIELTTKRLQEMIISNSQVLVNGEEDYLEKTPEELTILENLQAIPVQRNSGIDGFLKTYLNGKPVPIKIQKSAETFQKSIEKLLNSTKSDKFDLKILIKTNDKEDILLFQNTIPKNILVINSYQMILKNWLEKVKNEN